MQVSGIQKKPHPISSSDVDLSRSTRAGSVNGIICQTPVGSNSMNWSHGRSLKRLDSNRSYTRLEGKFSTTMGIIVRTLLPPVISTLLRQFVFERQALYNLFDQCWFSQLKHRSNDFADNCFQSLSEQLCFSELMSIEALAKLIPQSSYQQTGLREKRGVEMSLKIDSGSDNDFHARL